MDKLQRIKNEGFLVDVCHHRYLEESLLSLCPASKGGMTTVEIKMECANLAKFAKRQQKYGNIIVEGFSICSKKDSYNKKIGFHLALDRALSTALLVWPECHETFVEIRNEIRLTIDQNETE
jgi:hypothetical protein